MVLSLDDNEPIHEWFELTYAQYLTIPRSVLQSMPVEWQRRFVQCLEELGETIDWRPQGLHQQYRVALWEWGEVWDEDEGELVEDWIREVDDPLMDYQRGRRRIPFKSPDRE